MTGRDDEGLATVLDAERDAPEQVRYHFIARELALYWLRRTQGRRPALDALAPRPRVAWGPTVAPMSDAPPPPPMARPRVAAGVLVHDDQGRVLMVRPTYKDGWDIPGGYVEPDESPAQAAERELAEELNLRRAPGRLLVVDWAPHPAEGDKLLFVFDGGTLTPTAVDGLQLGPREIAEARYWLLDDVQQLAPARLVRRLELALKALMTGQTLYAERGFSPV